MEHKGIQTTILTKCHSSSFGNKTVFICGSEARSNAPFFGHEHQCPWKSHSLQRKKETTKTFSENTFSPWRKSGKFSAGLNWVQLSLEAGNFLIKITFRLFPKKGLDNRSKGLRSQLLWWGVLLSSQCTHERNQPRHRTNSGKFPERPVLKP